MDSRSWNSLWYDKHLGKDDLKAYALCLLLLFAKEAAVVGVLDEPYSQLAPLSGVAVQARQSV